jgi:hypothetical protein
MFETSTIISLVAEMIRKPEAYATFAATDVDQYGLTTEFKPLSPYSPLTTKAQRERGNARFGRRAS